MPNVKPIRNEKDYDVALKRINEIFRARLGSEEDDELEILISLVENYERKHYQIDEPTFEERLDWLKKHKGIDWESKEYEVHLLDDLEDESEIMSRYSFKGNLVECYRFIQEKLNEVKDFVFSEFEINSETQRIAVYIIETKTWLFASDNPEESIVQIIEKENGK